MVFSRSLSLRVFLCALCAALAVSALSCGADPSDDASAAAPAVGAAAGESPVVAGDARVSRAAPGARRLGRFEGEIDPFGGASTLHFIPAEDKDGGSAALPGVGRSPRTGTQLSLQQDESVLGYTAADCGPTYWNAKFLDEGPEWRFWLPEGTQRTAFYQRLLQGPPDSDGEDALRFCTEFTLRNVSSNTYGDLWLLFDGIALERGYAFVDRVPRRLDRLGPEGTDLEYDPVSDRGMFNYGPLAPTEEVTRQWYFYRAPGSLLQRFRVSGEVVELLHEQCGTGTDNNGDGIVDSGCGTVPGGDDCFLDADCASGSCDGASLAGAGPTEWLRGTCAFGAQGPPNLGASCTEDAECGAAERCAPQAQDRACVPDPILPGDVPMTFQFVPAAGAVVGSPADPPELGRFSNEAQGVALHTRSLFVMTTEVTQAQWKALMGTNPACWQDPADNGCSTEHANPDAPVEQISSWSAIAYANVLSAIEGLAPCYILPDPAECTGSSANGDLQCAFFEHPALNAATVHDCTGYRLPTDAEWEHAARAGTRSATPLGDLTTLDCALQTFLPTIARTFCDEPFRTAPTASLLPNPWGLHDMIGNVWERVWGSHTTAVPEGVNPANDNGGMFVVRGGGINGFVTDARSARRQSAGPNPAVHIGFRLVRSGPPADPSTDCGTPDAPDNGSAIPTAGTLLGAAVVSSCDPGFVLDGFPTRYCAPDGNWFPEAPTCTPALLGDPCTADNECPSGTWCPAEPDAGVTILDRRCAPSPELPGNVTMPFHLVPAAGRQFIMGSPQDEIGRDPSMEAEVTVALSRSFWMQRTELTQAQWGAVIAAAEDVLGPLDYGLTPAYGFANSLCDTEDCPVERVNWYEAATLANLLSIAEGLQPCYTLLACGGEGLERMGAGCGLDDLCETGTYTCQNATFLGLDCEGYRLPTDAEREFAARADDPRATYNGDVFDLPCDDAVDEIAWYACNADEQSQPVGNRRPNDFGLFDMLGNIIEWTGDRGEIGAPAPGGLDPIVTVGDERVLRSGGYLFDAEFSRAAARLAAEPDIRSLFVGMRLVRTVPVDAATTCPPLAVFGDYTIATTDGENFGSIATYTCSPGFSTEDFTLRVCSANGVWSGDAPFCEET